ncbi:Rieske (2Fe-2S) protein [Nocardioides sambongensis]|uniref:Rieske (2Fe-2S) protein n=1 Tax=Nocardioides sambongensis TaxID=2589074 RepID=UPI0011262076|nr:Rieske (2Fe-2S) protein [Nocardioides sambongensis]
MATLNRRHALGGAAAAGIGAPLLAACGGESADPDAPTTVSASPDGGNTPTSGAAEGGSSGGAASGLVAVDDVPVGGGVVVSAEEIVVTQPTDGEFKAFTAVCTHSQCLVTSVEDGEIVCPCHGSHFAVADGAVTSGPAPSALAEVGIEVVDGQVVRS